MPDPLHPAFRQQLERNFSDRMPYDANFSYFTSPPAHHSPLAPFPFHDLWAYEGLKNSPDVYYDPDTWPDDARLLPSFLLLDEP